MALKILIPGIDFSVNVPEKLDNPTSKVEPPIRPAAHNQKEPIQALSPPLGPKHFKAANLKEGLTDFIYQDGKPIQLKVKPSGLLYEVIPTNEHCQESGYCRHDLMPGGWCNYYPIFVAGKFIEYCRARKNLNSQVSAGSLI